MLKSEESQLDGNDIEPQNLKQQVEESELSENLPSPGGEEPRMFKQFDTVDDYSDHHFVDKTGKGSTSQVKIFRFPLKLELFPSVYSFHNLNFLFVFS